MLLMLQICVLIYHQILARFLLIQNSACECVNKNLLWSCYDDFTNFRVVAMSKKRIYIWADI